MLSVGSPTATDAPAGTVGRADDDAPGTAVANAPAVITAVTVSFRFEAAHHLVWHPGKCRNAHGHSYRLDVSVEGPLDEHDVVVDFDAMKATVDETVVSRWDHRDLNDLFDNPTAERLAHDAWERLTGAGLPVSALRLWETADASVELRRVDPPAIPSPA